MDELVGTQFFIKFDLQLSYHQMRIYFGDIGKTTFRTYQGHYKFLIMSFGFTNAPSTFQVLINEVFQNYLQKFVLVFFYDTLIYSRS